MNDELGGNGKKLLWPVSRFNYTYNLLGEAEEKHKNPESGCPGFEFLL